MTTKKTKFQVGDRVTFTAYGDSSGGTVTLNNGSVYTYAVRLDNWCGEEDVPVDTNDESLTVRAQS